MHSLDVGRGMYFYLAANNSEQQTDESGLARLRHPLQASKVEVGSFQFLNVAPRCAIHLVPNSCHLTDLVPLKTLALSFGAILFLTSLCVVGQDEKEQSPEKPPPVYNQLPEPVRKRYAKLFKPDFAKLNLAGTSSEGSDNHSKRIVEHFDSGSKISFRLIITNASEEEIVVYSQLDPLILNRPQLSRERELVSYRENVKELLQAKDRALHDGRSNVYALESKQSISETISLDDWYEPLQPGHYELSVWHRFIWGGEWLESPSVTFEVVQRVETPE